MQAATERQYSTSTLFTLVSFAVAMFMSTALGSALSAPSAEAKITASRTSLVGLHHHTPKTHSSSRHHSRVVVQYMGSSRRQTLVGSQHRRHYHHSKHHPGRSNHHSQSGRPRYAYPLDFFMMRAPNFDMSPLSSDLTKKIQDNFSQGLLTDNVSARALVRAGIAEYYPMHGGIFWRREPVKYIIMHSTETGAPLGAKRIIDSWSSMGRRHPGAQFMVDRDGKIYLAVDPDLATVHVNIFKTLPGINNDNSIGIEMVHTGKQVYTPEQKASVIRLVVYLQDRYKVNDTNIITHRYAQQGDHTDPVLFDWEGFLSEKHHIQSQAIATKMEQMTEEAQKSWLTDGPVDGPPASTYLQTHNTLPATSSAPAIYENDNNPQTPLPQPINPQISTQATSQIYKDNALAPQPSVIKSTKPPLRGPMEVEPSAAAVLSMPVQAMPAQAVPAPTPDLSTDTSTQVNFFVHQQQPSSNK